METTKQISVFLENKPGRLANVLLELSREKVNISALTIMDSHEHNVLRFTVDEVDPARKVLTNLSIPFAETEVLVVDLRNQPGELAHVCELLGADHINIEYAYCSSGSRNGKTVGIFKVSNASKAMRVLSEAPNNTMRRRLQQRPRAVGSEAKSGVAPPKFDSRAVRRGVLATLSRISDFAVFRRQPP